MPTGSLHTWHCCSRAAQRAHARCPHGASAVVRLHSMQMPHTLSSATRAAACGAAGGDLRPRHLLAAPSFICGPGGIYLFAARGFVCGPGIYLRPGNLPPRGFAAQGFICGPGICSRAAVRPKLRLRRCICGAQRKRFAVHMEAGGEWGAPLVED